MKDEREAAGAFDRLTQSGVSAREWADATQQQKITMYTKFQGRPTTDKQETKLFPYIDRAAEKSMIEEEIKVTEVRRMPKAPAIRYYMKNIEIVTIDINRIGRPYDYKSGRFVKMVIT